MLSLKKWAVLVGAVGLAISSTAQVVTYPFPRGLPASADYTVRTGGKEIFAWGTPAFSLAAFALTGETEVTVTAIRPFKKVVTRPTALGVQGTVEDNTVRFRLNRPCQLSVEFDDQLRRPLFLFADPPETNVPKPGDPNVRYFAGGQVHEAGEIQLRNGQTVYLAPGAVVRGIIQASGVTGARVIGRGILDATTRTNKMQFVALTSCTNIEPQKCTAGAETLQNPSKPARFHLRLLTKPNFSPCSGSGSLRVSICRAASRKILR